MRCFNRACLSLAFSLLAAACASPALPAAVNDRQVVPASTAIEAGDQETPLPQPAVSAPAFEPPPATADWVSGYVVGSRVEVGTGPKRLPIAGTSDLPIEPADESVSQALAALPQGDVLVILEGDYLQAPDGVGKLTVERIRLVNLPYTPDTSLDATYEHAKPKFHFNYPAGWFIESFAGGRDNLLTNAPIEATLLRPGRAYLDPTEVDFAFHITDAPSVEAYVDRVGSSVQESRQIGQTRFTRIEVAGSDAYYQYVTQIEDTVVVFAVHAYNVPFVERVLATLGE